MEIALLSIFLAVIVALAYWTQFSIPCPACKQKGGVTKKDRTILDATGARTVYNDCFQCSRCGYTYYVSGEYTND